VVYQITFNKLKHQVNTNQLTFHVLFF